MRSASPAVACLVLLVLFGVVEGYWTERWGRSSDFDEVNAVLLRLPRTVGEWDGIDQTLTEREISVARIKGYVSRKYVNRESKDSIAILLLCGRPGPLAAHTPVVCFPGGGFEMVEAPQRYSIEIPGRKRPADFWTTRFEKKSPILEGFVTLWAWTDEGAWIASDSPRVEFARSPVLFKLYVIHPLTKPDQTANNDPSLADFLRQFLPELQNTLFHQT